MKNNKGNKHIKNNPFMTLRERLNDNYYVILERHALEDTFDYIVTAKPNTAAYLDSALGMLDAAFFRNEKDAETFLTKIVRNNIYGALRELGEKERGSIPKEDIVEEMKFYRIMCVKELFSPHRHENELREMNHDN
jgi:hypothetical protein